MDRRAFLSGIGSATVAGFSGCSALGQVEPSESPVKIVTVDQPPHFQAEVMEREGFFGRLPVEIRRDRASPTSASGLLVSGNADVAMLGIVPALVAIDKGQSAHIVSASSKDAFVVLFHESAAMFFEAPDSGGFAGFRESMGRKVKLGTYPRGSSSDITARYWIEEEREADRSDVDLVPLDGAGASQQALLADEVDGAVIPEPTPTLIEERAESSYRRVASVGEFLPGQPAGVTVVREEYAAENPGVIEAFVEAHAEASRFIRTQPETAATYLSEAFGGERALDSELALMALDSSETAYLTDPHEIAAGAEVMAEYAARLGKIEQAYAADRIVETTYYDRVIA